ncbi:hypothetical protein CLV34_1524 [Luteimicrobium subarcticum]|uniref:Restriction endonuclease type II-like domain-containing protein n=1 Tax=Luteimicrobium subarcticum TaxID=620910 RepID=A0A2M8WSZ2_9MICO|nr:hypothetical protein CLV34_1524 [Luteimicrobium subarcticum]
MPDPAADAAVPSPAGTSAAPAADGQHPAAPPTDGRAERPAARPTDRPLPTDEAVGYALDSWRAAIVGLVGGSSLLDVTVLGDAVVDLSAAHPSGLAQLLAGRPTRLSNLFREPDALPAARRSARAVVAHTQDVTQRYGTAPTYLAIGVASWEPRPGEVVGSDDVGALARVATSPVRRVLSPSGAPSGTAPEATADGVLLVQDASGRVGPAEDGAPTGPTAHGTDHPDAVAELDAPAATDRPAGASSSLASPSDASTDDDAAEPAEPEGVPGLPATVHAPVLLRSLTIRPSGRGDTDFELTLEPTVEINSLLARALRDHGALIDPVSLAQGAFTGVGFDPSQVMARIRTLGTAVLDGFDLVDRTLVGSFVHPGQHLVDDLDELAPSLTRHEVVAALAGSSDVPVPLGGPLPARTTGDGDPALERGVGDLDATQRYVVDVLATGRHFAVDAPSGSDVVGTVAALVAEAAASGRHVLYVAGHRRAAEAVCGRLGDLGLGELTFEISTDPDWRPAAANRLLTAMAAEPAQIDLAAHAETMDALVGSRARLTAYIGALHLPREPFGVSAYEALQALARLTSERPAPATEVRLSAQTALGLDEAERAARSADLRRAAELGAFTLGATSTPWFGADLTTDDDAHAALARLDRLREHTLPRLRREIDAVSSSTGLAPATTLQGWHDVLEMLGGMRGTLDVFQPLVFEQSVADMVQATATKQWRLEHGIEMGSVVRRRLVRGARDLLRPGVRVDDLHAALLEVEAQRAVWATYSPAGGWPRLPTGLSDIEATAEAVRIDVDELSAVLAGTPGGAGLADLTFDDLEARLTVLADDRAALDTLPERTAAVRRVRAAGLGDLVEDLQRRTVPAGLVSAELDLAWWGSVFEQIVASDPALGGQDGPGLDALAARFRDLDRRHVEALPTAVLNEVRARTVAAMRADPEDTQALFGELLEGRMRSVRELHEKRPDLVRALRPVVVSTPTLVPQLEPATRTVDLVVLDAVQHVPVETLLSAIVRGRQVVVVGDVRAASGTAVRELARVLPTITLPSTATRRDPHLVRFLADHGYAGVLTPAPLPSSTPRVHLHLVDGNGMPDPASGAVESTQAEVDRVVELAIEHAMLRPEQTLAIVAVTPVHAARIRVALLAEVRRNPGLAGFFAGNRPEPVVVADLASVAGLSRDAVVLTLGFGKTPHGRVLHRFGQVGDAGGEALLLDAVGTTRERLDVISCFRAEELDPERLRGAGSRLLRDLLAFVEERDGAADPLVLWNGVDVGSSADRLVLDLAERLWRLGLVVETDYGPDPADRIPLVAGHPDLPGELLVAVLTDDDAYVAEPSTRVRERQRRARLERLGWTVVQVWAAAAFLDPEKEAERIRRAVHTARDARLGPRPGASVTGSIPRLVVDHAGHAVGPAAVGPAAAGPATPQAARAAVPALAERRDDDVVAHVGGADEPAADVPDVAAPDAETSEAEGSDSDGSGSGGRPRRRVVRQGTEQGTVTGVTQDELDLALPDDGGNDARLRQDVPPHWQ